MTEGRRRLPARRTGVLVLVVLSALAVALVVRGRPSGDATASHNMTTPAIEPDDAALALGLDRLTSIEQPLSVWLRIADCESGEWDADADPIPGSARWSYGTQADQLFQGGLHFEPSTWDDFRDPSMPRHAGEATPVAQLVVAERVLEEQGWKAWPVCSRKLGLR